MKQYFDKYACISNEDIIHFKGGGSILPCHINDRNPDDHDFWVWVGSEDYLPEVLTKNKKNDLYDPDDRVQNEVLLFDHQLPLPNIYALSMLKDCKFRIFYSETHCAAGRHYIALPVEINNQCRMVTFFYDNGAPHFMINDTTWQKFQLVDINKHCNYGERCAPFIAKVASAKVPIYRSPKEHQYLNILGYSVGRIENGLSGIFLDWKETRKQCENGQTHARGKFVWILDENGNRIESEIWKNVKKEFEHNGVKIEL